MDGIWKRKDSEEDGDIEDVSQPNLEEEPMSSKSSEESELFSDSQNAGTNLSLDYVNPNFVQNYKKIDKKEFNMNEKIEYLSSISEDSIKSWISLRNSGEKKSNVDILKELKKEYPVDKLFDLTPRDVGALIKTRGYKWDISTRSYVKLDESVQDTLEDFYKKKKKPSNKYYRKTYRFSSKGNALLKVYKDVFSLKNHEDLMEKIIIEYSKRDKVTQALAAKYTR